MDCGKLTKTIGWHKQYVDAQSRLKSLNLIDCSFEIVPLIVSKVSKIKRKSMHKIFRYLRAKDFWFLMICLMICITPTVANEEVEHFHPNTVAYVEKYRNVSEITWYWNMAVHTNLDTHYRDIDNIYETLDDLERRCKRRTENSVFTQVISNDRKR